MAASHPQATFDAQANLSLKREGMSNRKSYGQKWVKPLLKLILDFGFAKGKSAVEFREGS